VTFMYVRCILAHACLVPVLAGLGACTETKVSGYQGYVEGEYVLVAAPTAGRLDKRYVVRGVEVEAGAALFALETENEQAQRSEAEERVRSAEARATNLTAARRPTEIAAIVAQESQAAAARKLAASQLEQQQALYARGYISRASLDTARANFDREVARVAEIEAQLKTARAAIGRDKEIAAATAEVDAARAQLAQAEWRLRQRAIPAPSGGRIHDTFYSEGEWVGAGAPVVSLLPPGNVRIRFFVPETALGSVVVGQPVRANCDGCSAPIAAKVSYISKQAEYTPPVLYTREQRAKLVYLVEARPEAADAARLRPGQPLDIAFE